MNNGSLYFPPFLANEIAVLLLNNNSFEKIPFKKRNNVNTPSNCFIGAVSYNGYIFFTPNFYPAIMQMNVNTNELIYHTDWITPLDELTGGSAGGYFGHPLVIGDTIWLASISGNAVMEFNMETCKSVVHEVGEKGNRYVYILYDGETMWLSPFFTTKTPVIKWNPITNTVKAFPEIYSNDDNASFLASVYNNGDTWFFPLTGDYTYKINSQTDEVSIANEFALANEFTLADDTDQPDQPAVVYRCAQVHGNSVYAYNEHKETLVEYDSKTHKRRAEKIEYSPNMSDELELIFAKLLIHEDSKKKTINDCYIWENKNVLLKMFITYVDKLYNSDEIKLRNLRKRISQFLTVNTDGTSGKEIYSYVKKKVLASSYA
jgi:hypothetical protein